MKWLATILVIVGVLLIATVKLASVKHVDPSPETLHAMAELQKALRACEATQKRQADLDAPAPTPAPASEEAKRPREMRGEESKKQICLLEAGRLGKSPAVWCAGL